jgi:predicted membrane channel-forming protein YqfA (hemolysin III family)
MANLDARIKNALDEARILMLGCQVLLGFEYRSFFEYRFEQLTPFHQWLHLVALVALLVATALLFLTAARHRLVERGQNTLELLRFTVKTLGSALVPLAGVIGLDLYMAASQIIGEAQAWALGASGTAFALVFWYGFIVLRTRRPPKPEEEGEVEETKLEQRISEVLTEARLILPGAQTLLGFQLAIVMMEAFETLPQSSKLVHLAALLFIAAAVVLLMAPAAFHRIVEHGQDTERFHRFASAMVIAAMVMVAPGFAGDLFVVVRKLTDETGTAAAAALAALAVLYGLWFGVTLGIRARKRSQVSP